MTLLAGLKIFSIQSYGQTNDTCICGEDRIKAVLILANDAQANHEAYIEERSTRLADSSNYVFAIEKLKQSVNEQKEALKLCLAMPKEIIIKNPDWWKWFLGGTVTGAVIYFVVDNFLIKK